jgi:hypothetical protein
LYTQLHLVFSVAVLLNKNIFIVLIYSSFERCRATFSFIRSCEGININLPVFFSFTYNTVFFLFSYYYSSAVFFPQYWWQMNKKEGEMPRFLSGRFNNLHLPFVIIIRQIKFRKTWQCCFLHTHTFCCGINCPGCYLFE